MTQPRNLAQDTPGLPAAVPKGLPVLSTLMVKTTTNIQAQGDSHPLERYYRPLQRWDKIAPCRIDSKNLSGQVKPAPHNTNSKNLL
jgi:hypothetical protein